MKIPIILFAVLLFFSAQAGHLIGGNMSYRCVGNGQYEFTLKLYRDCSCSNCAELDAVAEIAIYRCTEGVDCSDNTQGTPFSRLSVPIQEANNVALEQETCGEVPPVICVDEGVYLFKATLPASEEDYHVVYQRCCRNITISNIVEPEETGFTVAAIIPAEICNDTPVFNNYPVVEIACVGQSMMINVAAEEMEGDSLVYEFINPLDGGGPIGTNDHPGNPTLCDGVMPAPPCPPPFDEVSFIAPTYSPLNPIPGDPMISLDAETGLITGTPTQVGLFLVGVGIKEYREGELLSFSKTEFQVVVVVPTSTIDVDEENVRIFPNPMSDWLWIEKENQWDIEKVQLINALGEVVVAQRVDGNEPRLNTRELAMGVYWCVLYDKDNRRIVRKVIKI